MKEETRYYLADFETSVYEGQVCTEVWSAAIAPLENYNEDPDYDPNYVKLMSSLPDFIEYVCKIPYPDVSVFFHNLKFDGSFILTYLTESPDWHEMNFKTIKGETILRRGKGSKKPSDMSYTYSITMRGIWYSITLGYNGKIIRFIDSAKILPFSLKKLGKDFQTTHQKLEMEYTGERHAGYVPTKEEEAYIKNDILVLKEAIQIARSMGLTELTIGSCCMKEYKDLLSETNLKFRTLFPDLCTIWVDHLGLTVDEYIRAGYHGGWCYCKEDGKHVKGIGCVFDWNSLYPSVMSGESGNRYPVGFPKLEFKLPDDPKKFYYVRFRCHFDVKPNHLPTVQIKSSFLYEPTEWLKTSTVYGKNGEVDRRVVELVMARPDYELFMEQYDVDNLEILDCLTFNTEIGIFDAYIKKWREVKETSKGAKRTIAKLMLNNLYGKFASSMDSSYKMVVSSEDGLRYEERKEWSKEPGYIAIGAAITAYARCATIRAAQKNYDVFCYADTDSIHCACRPEEVVDCPEDPVKFLHWKCESTWNEAVFARQKTYIEKTIEENHEPVPEYWKITCAGMGRECKQNLNEMLKSGELKPEDFKSGLTVPGNLKAKQIKGGTLLVSMVYKMR